MLLNRTLFFAAGFSTLFLLIGALVVTIEQSISGVIPWIFRIGAVLTILLGLALLGKFRFALAAGRLTARLRRISFIGSPRGSYTLGLSLAVAWIPCVGRIMAIVIALSGTTQRIWEGLAMLAAYCLGLTIPFLAIAVFGAGPIARLRRFRHASTWATTFAGVALIVVGIMMLTGWYEAMEHAIKMGYKDYIPGLFAWFHHLHSENWWHHIFR